MSNEFESGKWYSDGEGNYVKYQENIDDKNYWCSEWISVTDELPNPPRFIPHGGTTDLVLPEISIEIISKYLPADHPQKIRVSTEIKERVYNMINSI